MSKPYTNADMMTARVAVGAREQCVHEASGRLSTPCVGCDLAIALDAVAPNIAARALREAAERIVAATFERLSRYDGEHAETARDAITGCVDHLIKSADHIEARR